MTDAPTRAELIEAFAPFVETRCLPISTATKLIRKNMSGLTPVPLTVTLDQLKRAVVIHNALAATPSPNPPEVT